MKKIISLIIVLSSLVPALAWGRLKVVTTLPSYADIAQNVGGEEVDVVSLTKGTQDPHFVDPKPDIVLKLNRADLLIRAGLGLEDGWLPPLLSGARNGKIQPGGEGYLEASSLIELKEVPAGGIDRSMGDVHPGGNPHFMLDPRNGMKLAKGIADRLGKLEPSKAADFQKRAEQYNADLQKKIQAWEALLKPFSGKQVVTYHKSWVYFSGWAGLKEVDYVEPKPGVPPSPEHVVKLIRLMKDKKVPFVIIEPYYPKGTAEQVARESGARLLVLPNEVNGSEGAKNYFALFDEIIAKLKGGK